MNQREVFQEAILARFRMILQKHERELQSRAHLAHKIEELKALDRIPEQLPILLERRHLAKLQAEERLAHDGALLDAALLEFADYLFDTIHLPRTP